MTGGAVGFLASPDGRSDIFAAAPSNMVMGVLWGQITVGMRSGEEQEERALGGWGKVDHARQE